MRMADLLAEKKQADHNARLHGRGLQRDFFARAYGMNCHMVESLDGVFVHIPPGLLFPDPPEGSQGFGGGEGIDKTLRRTELYRKSLKVLAPVMGIYLMA